MNLSLIIVLELSPYTFFLFLQGEEKMRAMISVVVQIILSCTIFRMRDKQSNHTVIGLFCKSFPIYFILRPCLKFLLGLQSEN